MDINPKIFKPYDIRGIYPDEVNEEAAYRIGSAFVVFTGAQKVMVGRDGRVSGPALHTSLIKGIIEQGADVLDIGQASTDMFYYACGSQHLPGIMVTASHNPAEYNGFKLVKEMPDLVSGEDFLGAASSKTFSAASRKGSVRPWDIRNEYRKKVLSLADVSKIPEGLTIVVDPANGMGGVAYDIVYKDIPVTTVKLFFEPDGTFPNHGGDPTKEENRRDLCSRVKAERADLGFAFDTDADRFFAVDSTGVYVPNDFLGALLAKYLIEKHGGGTIVTDALIGWAMRDLVREAGGTVFMSRVGHVFIKREMDKNKALFGVEKSGHYYLPDFYFAESAVGTSLMLLEMLGHCKKSLHELTRPLREKYHMIEPVNFKVSDPDAVLDAVRERYSPSCEIQELDGISIIAENWHANVRKSNTEPVVRLNVEALDGGLMEQKRDELLKLIQG
ncbi:MAG: phosphomannomutase/phosphoglucomutase [Parcubacteria group bacterium]|nr:phosphomannomutase/phosphoglucomutase [Parcubacteria group bacterium]